MAYIVSACAYQVPDKKHQPCTITVKGESTGAT